MIMKILTNYYLPIILVTALLFCTGNGLRSYKYKKDTQRILTNTFIGPCPAEVEDNRNYLESFITDPEWEQARQETNTDHLTISQITLLQSPEYSSACETFNNRFNEAFSETYSDGSREYEITYYKVDTYYFVIISRRQPTDPELVASGVEYITIFDDNLNVVKGYFF